MGPTPIFFRQDVYQLNQDMVQHDGHPGLSANQTPSAQFAGLSETSWVAEAMPARSGLYICLILFSQYVIISYTQYTLNKVCIGPLCLYQCSEVNPELPRT